MYKLSLRISLGLLFVFVMSMSLIAQQPRNGEEVITDDDIELTVLENGVQFDDFLVGGVGARLYAFNGSEGDNIRISMIQEPETDIDPYLILLGNSGQVLVVDDDGGPAGRSAEISGFELPFDGTFLIVATTFGSRREQTPIEDLDNDEEQHFEIRLSGNTPPRGVEAGDLELLVNYMDIGDFDTLELTQREPVALVVIELLEGDVVSLDAWGDDVDTLIYLFDPFGTRLAVNDDRAPGNYSSRLDTFEAEEDGFYLVFVTVFNFYEAPDTDLSLGEVDFEVE